MADPKVLACLHCYCAEAPPDQARPIAHLVCCKCGNIVGAAFAGEGVYEALLEFRRKFSGRPS